MGVHSTHTTRGGGVVSSPRRALALKPVAPPLLLPTCATTVWREAPAPAPTRATAAIPLEKAAMVAIIDVLKDEGVRFDARTRVPFKLMRG